MTKGAFGACITLAIALIGAAATVGSAYIQRPRETREQEEESAPKSVSTSSLAVAPTIRETHISVTGVQIGAAKDESFVVEQRTVFDSNEEIAATVHFIAADGIRSFPVRLTATFGNPLFGQLSEEKTADVASPGDSLVTFRFPPRERTPGSYLFLVQVNGARAYDQMIDIK